MDTDPLPASNPLLAFAFALVRLVAPAFDIYQLVALILAIVALFISAFMSGSEIAYFSLSEEQHEEIDDVPSMRRAASLLKSPERLLATLLIGNNLINVTIVILCNYALGPVFEGMSALLSFILQTVLLTFLILLFGEILPKLIAKASNMQWVKMSAGALTAMTWLFYPLSSMLVRSSTIVNKVVTKKHQDVTADELSQALEITDVAASDDKQMLEGILKFGDKTATEIMTPRVDITDIDINSSFDQVMRVVIDSGYSRLPVYQDNQDNIRGVLYSRDLLPYIGKADSDFAWQKLLREAYFVPESRMIDDLLEDFRRRRIHMAVVVDEFGGTQGIVTLEDVLEEIVGEINDEYDQEDVTYKRLPDNTFVFEGKTLLGDFFRVTGLDEDEFEAVTEDCETLAGMLLSIKGDFPKEKEPLAYGRCRFLVLDISQHRINSVRVKVL